MSKLDNLINNLNNDRFQAVTIVDNDTGEKICQNLLGTDIIEKYGSAEDFFDNLDSKTGLNLTIISRRKNGSVFKTVDTFEIEPDEEPVKKSQGSKESIRKKKKKKKKKNEFFGLGFPDVLDMKISAFEKNRLEAENIKLAEQNDILKRRNDELERNELERKYTVQKSDSFNNMLTGLISQAPTILKAVGLKVDVPNAAIGLSAPEMEDENISPVQKEFIEVVKNTSDEMIQILYGIIAKIESGEDNDFAVELDKVLRTFKIIQEDDNH